MKVLHPNHRPLAPRAALRSAGLRAGVRLAHPLAILALAPLLLARRLIWS